jgi:hypothetical protein
MIQYCMDAGQQEKRSAKYTPYSSATLTGMTLSEGAVVQGPVT